MAKRHAAEQHQFIGQIEKGAHGALPGNPSLLRAGVEAITAGEQHDRLDIAAKVGPLGWQHGSVDGKKQADRRAEELKVPRILPVAARAIFARNTDGAVKQFPDAKTAA